MFSPLKMISVVFLDCFVSLQIGTWENKDVEFEELRDQSMGKFSSVENLTDGTDGTELWTDSGMGE
jgi:hypothetical protein